MQRTLPVDPDVFRGLLRESLDEILETIAYTVAYEELPASALESLPAVSAEIDFLGTHEGRISVTASRSVAARLAASLSGLDACELQGREDLLEDAMRETANMTAGVFLRRVVGRDDELRLGLPQTARERPHADVAGRVGASVTVETIDGPIGADLCLRLASRAKG